MQYFMKYWICATGGVPIQYTPLGRAWNANDGSLGTTSNAAFLSAVYAQATKCVVLKNRLEEIARVWSCHTFDVRCTLVWSDATATELRWSPFCTSLEAVAAAGFLQQPKPARNLSRPCPRLRKHPRHAYIVKFPTLPGLHGCRSSYAGKSKRYVCFARGQTRYVLGEAGTSYQVGYGKKYSQFPQVMGASCPGEPFTGKAQVGITWDVTSHSPLQDSF